MKTKLEDLNLRSSLLRQLWGLGYETVGDMAHLSVAETLRIPGMGGIDWRRIAKAQHRDPYPLANALKRNRAGQSGSS